MRDLNSVLVEGRFSDMGDVYQGRKLRLLRVNNGENMIVLPVQVNVEIEKEGLETYPVEEQIRIVGRVCFMGFIGVYIETQHWERVGR